MNQNLHFKPYQVVSSDRSIEQIFDQINENIYWNYCHQKEQLDYLSSYSALLETLNELNIEVVPYSEASFKQVPKSNRPQCLIRHDLDIDVVTALRMAEIEAEYNIRTSWFVLHTAPYYGAFQKNYCFSRNSSMRHVYLRLQELGHEVALHTDGLGIYQIHNTDGASAITQEIDWLRASDIDICGTTAHNSWGVYGAENFAIFKGKPQKGGTRPEECPELIEKDGCWARLQVLSEEELGLKYEANEVFWQNHTPVRYAALRARNEWRWSDKHSRIETQPLGGKTGFITTEELHDNLKLVLPCEWLVLVIHPIYYGWRHAPYAAPGYHQPLR